MASIIYVVTSAVFADVMLRGQLAYLAGRGFDITAVADGNGLSEVGLREGVATVGVAMEREISPVKDLKALAELWALFRGLRPRIVNAGTPKAGLLGMMAATAAGVPARIYTLHGLRLETTAGLKRLVLTAAEKLACCCATHVVCVSESLRLRAVSLGVLNPAKALVLGRGSVNGVDVERFRSGLQGSEEVATLRKRLGIPPSAPVVGFVGRFVRDKGISDLVECFTQIVLPMFREARLVLVGEFEKGDPVPAHVRKQMLNEPAVVSVGFVADTAPYYRLMDVVVFPSYREGFGNVLLEAAASAVPVVAYAATGTVDAVWHGETGTLVAVGDVAALGRVTCQYLASSELRRQHGEAGRGHAVRWFRSEMVWTGWESLYRKILSGASGGVAP